MRNLGGLFGGLWSRIKWVGGLLLWPMTPSKLVKLGLLGLIFSANFNAWGAVFGDFFGSIIPFLGGALGQVLAIVAFCFCQWSEVEPDLMSIGCEEPEANLRKAKLAAGSPVYAGMLRQDAVDEFDNVDAVELARAKVTQLFSFAIDGVISGTAWYPFSSSLLALLIAPMGFLDFNLFNLFALITTVFWTPRILISAMKDGRIKSAKKEASHDAIPTV